MTDLELRTEPPPEEQGPPVVVVNGRHLPAVTNDIVGYLHKANQPPTLYVRAGQLTRVRFDENRRPSLELVQADQLQHRIGRVVHTVRALKDGGYTPVPCPAPTIKDILASTDWPFPALESITEIPTLRPDGTIHDKAGYDRATRRLHLPARGLDVPPVPAHPTDGDTAAAVDLLTEQLLGDFPFETQADLANAVALLLTPIVRPSINGQIPLALVDAPEPGTGKGLLANVANVVATGRPAAARPLAGNDDEVRKMLTAVLLEGPALVVLDNVEAAIKSPTLAAVLTTDEWSDRLLGRTETITVPNRATWVATGNNLSVGGDIGRRCYRIRLDAHQARPYTRTGFRHPDLIGYAQDQRGAIVHALLTLARAWHAADRPEQPDQPTIGGFTPWARTIAGILGHAGITGFLANLAELHASLDVEAQSWEAFLVALEDEYRDRQVTVADIANEIGSDFSSVRHAIPADLADHVGRPAFTKRLGDAFRKREGRRHGSDELAVLNVGRSRTKVALWQVVRLGNPLTPRLFDTNGPDPRGPAGSPANQGHPEGAGSTSADTPEHGAARGHAGATSPDTQDDSKSHVEVAETDPAGPRDPARPYEDPFDPEELF